MPVTDHLPAFAVGPGCSDTVEQTTQAETGAALFEMDSSTALHGEITGPAG